MEAERARFTVRGCLGLLKFIQSVALIVFGRDLAMKVLVTQSSVLSFVFRYVLTTFLLSGLHEYSVWLHGGIGLLKSIQNIAWIFGRALTLEVSASKSSVLDFVFATCCWRSGCIEVHVAHFDRE